MTNEALREHTTSIGFSLTLSKSMINHLVLLHHFKGDKNALTKAGFLYHPATWGWTTSTRALLERGLITHQVVWSEGGPKQGHVTNALFKPTKAGTLVVNLLKEAGIYQERLADLLESVEKGYYRHRGTNHILHKKGIENEARDAAAG